MSYPRDEFSAKVELELVLADRIVPVAQTCDAFIITEGDFACGPTRGTLAVTVDGRRHEQDVELPEGIDPSRDVQPIIDRSPSPF